MADRIEPWQASPWRATLRRGRDVRGGRTWPGRARRSDATERVPPFMGGCAFPGGPRSVVAGTCGEADAAGTCEEADAAGTCEEADATERVPPCSGATTARVPSSVGRGACSPREQAITPAVSTGTEAQRLTLTPSHKNFGSRLSDDNGPCA